MGADEVVVRSGDTLTAIARRHDLSLERLVELNDLADPNRIFAGQTLRLEPGKQAPPASTAAPAATVRTHVSRAMVKLGARDRAQLVVLAYESGLVRPGWRE